MDDSALGQVFEFRSWADLIVQSDGRLHVFLPLLDRGLDAVVHRLTDGAYIGVQAKCRSSIRWRELHIVVPAEELWDDSAMVLAGLHHEDGLGPYLLLMKAGEFKRQAYHWDGEGGRYEAWFSEEDPQGGRWAPYVVERNGLGQAFLELEVPGARPAAAVAPGEAAVHDRKHDRWLGFIGEAEVIRQLAVVPELDLFRPFPDLELVEVLARRHESPNYAGLQIKAAIIESGGRQAHSFVAMRTFRPTADSFVVALLWLPEAERFHDECLLIPTVQLPRVAKADGAAYLINWAPRSDRGSKWDPFRVPLDQLGQRVLEVTRG